MTSRFLFERQILLIFLFGFLGFEAILVVYCLATLAELRKSQRRYSWGAY